jgi:predicted RNA-binding protein
MCDASAYIVRDGKEEKILEDVELVEVQGDEARIVSIFGDQKVLRARLKRFDNSQGKLLFEPL